tara:strand:+ start:169 stop:621 length:453 start_codon:yes stop_codon:yes gene_type:complete
MKFTRSLPIFTGLALLLTVSACSDDEPNADIKNDMTMTEKEPKKPSNDLIAKTAEQKRLSASDEPTEVTLTGTIVYKEMEGGFYAFIAEGGERYTLRKLDKKFHRNGLIVKVTGMPMPDVMTITQYGTVLQVKSVEILDASRVIGNASSH